jgi:hypothetical protein
VATVLTAVVRSDSSGQVHLGLAAAARSRHFPRAPARTLNCSRTQASTRLIAVPNDFMDVGPQATRETLARAGYPLLSGGASSARSPWSATPEEDQAVAEGGGSHGMGGLTILENGDVVRS